jgi:Flp pilus assembly protein TadD
MHQLGFLLQLSGSTKDAADHYLAALRQNPQDITAAANLAVIEAASGQSDQAIRLLNQVVQEDPSQTSVGLNLAFLQCRKGKQVDAIAVLMTMLQYNPDSAAAHRFLETGVYGDQHCNLR